MVGITDESARQATGTERIESSVQIRLSRNLLSGRAQSDRLVELAFVTSRGIVVLDIKNRYVQLKPQAHNVWKIIEQHSHKDYITSCNSSASMPVYSKEKTTCQRSQSFLEAVYIIRIPVTQNLIQADPSRQQIGVRRICKTKK